MNYRLKKIGNYGFSHVIVPAIIALLIGGIGVYTLARIHANPLQDSSTSGPFVTLLFSRSEVTAADNCTENDTDIAPLLPLTPDSTAVAPFLQSLGFSGTGTLVTGNTQQSSYLCTHNNDSLGASWDAATTLAQQYGWSFVSHTADYPGPAKMARLTTQQQYNETCGSAATIDAHGLPGGHGMIAYPGLQTAPTSLQSVYGAECFAWGRTYGNNGLTSSSAGSTAPYWQNTEAVMGGPCNDKTQTQTGGCYNLTATGSKRYKLPSKIIAQIQALQPGQWLTIQAYLLVNGTNDTASPIGYTNNKTQWDCSSSNPSEHWTNDVERYCYSDYQQIVNAISTYNQNINTSGSTPITVTDPLTVGKAFTRPSTYQ